MAKGKYARDLSGAGARIYGGRWNEKGIAVVYTASSPALATVELLVHVDANLLPTDLRWVFVKVRTMHLRVPSTPGLCRNVVARNAFNGGTKLVALAPVTPGS